MPAGRYGEARVKLQEALRTFPRHVGLRCSRCGSWPPPQTPVRDGDLALEIARRVYAERQNAAVRAALALAYARSGRFTEAADLQRQLLAEAEGVGDPALTKIRRSRLTAFEGGEAWSAKTPDDILAGA